MQKIVFSPKLIEILKEGSAADPQTPRLSVLGRQGVPVVFSFKRKVKGTVQHVPLKRSRVILELGILKCLQGAGVGWQPVLRLTV